VHSLSEIAAVIDHTLLKPDASHDQIIALCSEARRFGFAAVCINSYWVPVAVRELGDGPVKVCTVTGFPLGACSTAAKVADAGEAIDNGAVEIDMVINLGALRSGDPGAVRRDIEAVVEECHRGGAITKVILETSLLTDAEKVEACLIARDAGAEYVKTSTGFAGSGATVHDVELMRRVVGPRMGVKASGGIRTLDEVERMLEAGASRIGASASVRIVEAAAVR
jgi:deoxyribose-phosphate aldolase